MEGSQSSTGKVSPNTVAKLLNDFSEQRTSAKRLKWIKGIAVVMFLLALAAAGFWWRATNAQHAAELAAENEKKAREAAEEQARIANVRRLAAESSSALREHPQRSFLLAVGPIVLSGHSMQINSVAISSDNHWVVTNSWDLIALWDLTAKNLASNPSRALGRQMKNNSPVISSDNPWLATGSKDNTARLWLLQVSDLIELARVVAGRNLSAEESKLYFPGEPYHKTFPDLPGPDSL
jgi:hypothetical protein